LQDIWEWWVANGLPIEHLVSVISMTLLTIFGAIGLSAWKRRQRSETRTKAAKEIVDAAEMIHNLIVIERVSHEPMVHFTVPKAIVQSWREKAIESLKSEVKEWEKHKIELKRRKNDLTIAVQRNSPILDRAREIQYGETVLLELLDQYDKAIDTRLSLVNRCIDPHQPDMYQDMPTLDQLPDSHPELWRSNRSEKSTAFESRVRKTMDEYRIAVWNLA
jgi:hypothetical protein